MGRSIRQRKRINISISPQHYDELQRICTAYGFINLCEICTALLSTFIQRVNMAEGKRGKKKETNEQIIQNMFAEFENWQPVPNPSIMYKRGHTKNSESPAKVVTYPTDRETEQGRDDSEIADSTEEATDCNGCSIASPGSDRRQSYTDDHHYYDDDE